jgi:hypothetical protein
MFSFYQLCLIFRLHPFPGKSRHAHQIRNSCSLFFRGRGVGLLDARYERFEGTDPSLGSAARVGKRGDRSDPENHWENEPAVAINSYRPFLLLRVIEDDGRHNLD